MDVTALGQVRGLGPALDNQNARDDNELQLTGQLELITAPGAPAYQEFNRLGRSFYVSMAAAVAAVVAVPTTGHLFSLYNNAADGGRSLIIDWVAALNIASTAVASQATLLGNVGQIRETAPADAALAIKKANGYLGGSVDTVARTLLTGTALPAGTGLAANWFPLGPNASKPGSATTPGYAAYAQIDGRIIIPPGRYFAIHVLANVVGETFIGSIGWHEAILTLG